jgi:hypothetical protein
VLPDEVALVEVGLLEELSGVALSFLQFVKRINIAKKENRKNSLLFFILKIF